MINLKRLGGILLALALTAALAVPVFSAVEDTGFSDVDAGAWYAEAVAYCRESGLMAGVGGGRFAPDSTLTRAMLVTVLWRQAGSPVVNYLMRFDDVPEGQWYSEGIHWAASEGLVRGYGDGRYGTNDPITQQQLDIILNNYLGRTLTQGIPGFDGSAAPATRAQVAAVLLNLSRAGTDTPSQESRTLVAYFSATNNTEHIANHIAAIRSADLYEIVPETPYTSSDLNYNDNSSRANQEQNDPAARPAISGDVEDMAQYDVIFLGYPIWHGQAPRIISTFLERYDLTGKTIVPFCISGSSPIGSSARNLQSLASGAAWLEGQRFSGSASRDTVASWVNGLALSQQSETNPQEESDMLNITVNGTTLTATLADNSSAQALRELLAAGPRTIQMSDYDNMEKVGPLGQSLPTNNEQINTQAGDIILYQGNQIVIYYDTNSWNFTRLGKINGVTAQGLRNILGSGDVSVVLSLG